MFISPFLAAVIIGSFWTGVGTTAVLNHTDMWKPHSDVVITATTTTTAHREACYAHYRSYVGSTDMYMGFDGSWHPCQL